MSAHLLFSAHFRGGGHRSPQMTRSHPLKVWTLTHSKSPHCKDPRPLRHSEPLRAVAWHLELRCGQMVLEACVGGVRGEPLRGVARGRPPAQYYYSGTACQCMCACSQRADVPAFVPRVVPHAVSAHARLEACWRGGAAPCMLSTAM